LLLLGMARVLGRARPSAAAVAAVAERTRRCDPRPLPAAPARQPEANGHRGPMASEVIAL